jgi:hypothetical protein
MAAVFSVEFLRGLVRRGLKGIKLAIADVHEGAKGGDHQGPGRQAIGSAAALHAQHARLHPEEPVFHTSPTSCGLRARPD